MNGRWGEVHLTYYPQMNRHSLAFGRTGLGLPYAQVTYGSVVYRANYGLTVGHAIARAIRWYRKHGKHVEGTADLYRRPGDRRPVGEQS